jgi:hypothetical protein
MTIKTQGAVTTLTAPTENNLPTCYKEARPASSLFGRNWVKQIQEVLGDILLALHWPRVTDCDRAALLLCVERLERKLIDFRRRGNTDG